MKENNINIKKISHVVILLGLVSLLNDVSSEIIMALMPMFLLSIGGSSISIGIIGGAEECLRSILSYISGSLSDRIKKRLVFIFSGYSISSISKLFLVLANNWIFALILRLIDRGGKAIRNPARDAMIASVSNKNNMGLSFGIHRAMDTSGALIGSILALALFWHFNLSMKTLIFIGAIIAFSSLIPLIWVKEKRNEKSKPIVQKINHNLPKSVWFALLPIFIFYLANFTYMFFLLKVNKAYTDKLAIGMPLLMYLIFNFTYTLFSIPAGYFADKWGRKKLIMIGYIIYAITTAGFSLFQTNTWFITLFSTYGISYAFVEGNQRAYLSILTKKASYGTTLGTFYFISGIASLLSSLIAGFLFKLDPNLPFLYASILSIIAAILFNLVHNP
jgi:MFS family permease